MANCLINNTGNKGANGVMIQILNFFVSNGYTPTQACAIAGNVQAESSYIPNNVNELGCKGLFQWCFSREEKLVDRYGKNGWQNVNNQLEYVWDELKKGGERGAVGTYFRENKGKTLSEYTYHWLRYFETPSENENELRNNFLPTRLKEAKKAAAIYEQLNKGECVVDTSDGGSSSNQNFSCNVDGGETLASDISIVEDSTVQTTTSQPNGNCSTAGNAKNSTVDTKPLFAGDSWAYKIWHNDEYMKKNWALLAKDGLSMSNLTKQLKRALSNKNRRPKYIVIYCGDDTTMKYNTSSAFVTGSTESVKKWCRELMNACNGIQIYFCENVMDSIYRVGESNYYLTAASVLNRVLKKIKSDGDSANFRIIKFDDEFKRGTLRENAVVTNQNRMTLNPTGFSKMGQYIREKIHGGS